MAACAAMTVTCGSWISDFLYITKPPPHTPPATGGIGRHQVILDAACLIKQQRLKLAAGQPAVDVAVDQRFKRLAPTFSAGEGFW